MRPTLRSYFLTPVQVEHEEIEWRASNEPDLFINDTESMVGNPFDAGETEDTSELEEGYQREFTFGGMLWDASWVDNMDLYDDLDDRVGMETSCQEKILRV